MMELSEILFYALAIASAVFGVFTVLTKHILRAAVYLMTVLLFSAGLYLLLGAELIAGIQVLVYVGGIVVLLVFAVMLTRTEDLAEDRPSGLRKTLGAVAATLFFASSAVALKFSPLGESLPLEGPAPVIKDIGRALLDTGPKGFVVPFEVISLLLLAVLIAGVVIARKEEGK